ncbi:hypothetical protein [Campylobacter porcelli]|nr:hypothetical protein [Campylobacter sp. P0124]
MNTYVQDILTQIKTSIIYDNAYDKMIESKIYADSRLKILL